MPDMSDYLHNKKVALLKFGKQAADATKFRAPTRDTVYDANLMGGSSCSSVGAGCNNTVKHNTFAAQQFCRNPAKTTG